jgi:hypothetical protein
MTEFISNKLKILEKMSDQSGWSASKFERTSKKTKSKMKKGNVSKRYLHPMENENVIVRDGTRKTESNQNEIPYHIAENIDIFGSIVRQLVKEEVCAKKHSEFLSSNYTNNIIKKSGFS